jgi:ABC-2 type transport system permease protein
MTHSLRLARAYVRTSTLELARYPGFSVPTLAFPALLFVFFVVPRETPRPEVYLASYAAFAVLGVAFFQFGVGLANERASPWEAYLRTLPAPVAIRFGARVASALVFAAASAGVVVAVAVATTGASLPLARWLALAVVLAIGAIPLALLGIAIGYWSSPRAALPIANLVYLALAFGGGLWTGPQELPGALERVSWVLPTRLWGEALWDAVLRGEVAAAAWAGLAAYGAAFGLFASWGYRRDEGQRFR